MEFIMTLYECDSTFTYIHDNMYFIIDITYHIDNLYKYEVKIYNISTHSDYKHGEHDYTGYMPIIDMRCDCDYALYIMLKDILYNKIII